MTTAQEQRDQDYLEGYGVGITGPSLTTNELWTRTISFVRGYWAGIEDFKVRSVA